ncbi:MAG: lipopolysaccharide biosynthesis protein [Bacteroidota bacterium]
MISTRFIKSSILITLGNALPLLSGIALLPFYINVLSLELFGELAIYISISLLAQIFFGLGLETYINIVPVKFKDEYSLLQKGIGSLFNFTIIIGLLFITLSFFTGTFFFNQVFNNQFGFFPFGFLSILTAFFNNFFKLHNNLLLGQQKINGYFIANVINFIATLSISLIGLLYFNNSLWGPILGRFLSGIIIFFISLFGFLKYYKFKLQLDFLRKALKFSIPMFLFFVFNWAMNYFDRIIIENNMPLKDLAVYDFATKCCLPLEFLQNGLFAAIAPLIYKIWRDTNIKQSTLEVNRYFNGYSAIFLILAPLSCVLIPLVVPFVINKEIYFESFKYIGIMAVGYCFKAYYFVYYIVVLYHHKTKIMPLVFLILASIQITLMIISTHYFGIMGIILSSLIVKIIQPQVMFFFSKKIFSFSFNKLKIIYLPLLFLAMVLISQFFINSFSIYLIYTLQLLLSLIAIYFVYKKELIFVTNKYLKK